MQLLETRPTVQDPLPDILEDAIADLAFAGRAAVYLDKKGLNHRAVVQCLIDEFELDRATAEAVASLAA
jgi:hypothetical protein